MNPYTRIKDLEERVYELEGFCESHISELFDRVDALTPAPKKKKKAKLTGREFEKVEAGWMITDHAAPKKKRGRPSKK